MPYRVAGQVIHDGPPRVVLARDDRVFFVREGDTLDGGYRVESIKSDAVTLVYTPLDERQKLPVASALQVPVVPPAPGQARAGTDAPAAGTAPGMAVGTAPGAAAAPVADGRPAQLRWEGPAQVQAGSEFEVALKITSDKAVRGSPMQLSYDAKALEPVAVRAGEFFADGSFTYRGKRREVQLSVAEQYRANIGLSRDFFGDRLSLSFSVNNIFNSNTYNAEMDTPEYSLYSHYVQQGVVYTGNVVYRFNRKKGQMDRMPTEK